MGQQQEEQEEEKQPSKSLRSKAVHLVSDLTTVLLNPISDNNNYNNTPPTPSSSSQNAPDNSEDNKSDSEEGGVDGPDTSSFSAFLYSLLASSESNGQSKVDSHQDDFLPSPEPIPILKESGKRKGLFSRGKQTLGRAFSQAAKLGGFRNQSYKSSSSLVISEGSNTSSSDTEGIRMKTLNEAPPPENLPETSESSLLLSEKTRSVLYSSLPVIVKGRKWVLLYSTWRHGISLSTLYRRSMLWPGLSLLVVGDRKGAVFGGLVEAPLKPTNKKYQGTNDSFVFTNVSGHPLIYRPTGINRYFTLCSKEYLALGGGSHFALYLDSELLCGTSSSSETYGNPCLAHTLDFQVKEIELWGFIYASQYKEMIASSRTEAPGICHW